MKLTAKKIEEIKFSVDRRGYSAVEVDNFLDEVMDDYRELENNINDCEVYISSKFTGVLMPNSVAYEGTIAEWQAIENKGSFAEIPCIICRDGQYIQKL